MPFLIICSGTLWGPSLSIPATSSQLSHAGSLFTSWPPTQRRSLSFTASNSRWSMLAGCWAHSGSLVPVWASRHQPRARRRACMEIWPKRFHLPVFLPSWYGLLCSRIIPRILSEPRGNPKKKKKRKMCSTLPLFPPALALLFPKGGPYICYLLFSPPFTLQFSLSISG